jgi:hypothetical protein
LGPWSMKASLVGVGRRHCQILIVCWSFECEDDVQWNEFELQSCRSRRKLQFSYKIYLLPSS